MKIDKIKVADFTTVITGGTPSTSIQEYWDGDIPWINSGDLNQGLVFKPSNYITQKGLESSSAKIMPKNSVLIALTGSTTGVSALLKIEACGNQSVTGILPSKRHHPEYLYHFFKTQRKRIFNSAWGGAQPHINQQYVKDYIIPLPQDINDQVRIAFVLDKTETLIAKRKETIRLLDEFVKSVFLDMFGDPVKNEKRWEKKTLKSIAAVRIGPFGSLLHREDYVSGGIPLVNPSHIVNGKIIVDEKVGISILKLNELSSYVLSAGDIVLGRRGEIGRCALVSKDEDGYICGTGSMFIRPVKKNNSVFLLHLISFPTIKQQLENVALGVTMKNLNSKVVENLNIITPAISVQDKFAAIIEKAEVVKQQNKDSLNELEDLYASLSQRAFKGELNLSNVYVGEFEEYSATDNDRTEPSHFQKPLVREAYINKKKEKKKKLKQEAAPAWSSVSVQQIAGWINNRYTSCHFSFEMLHRFLSSHIPALPYYTTKELLTNPKLNEAESLKGFIKQALTGKNPFLKLRQFFYDAEKENKTLNIIPEDYDMVKDRPAERRSGIYYEIIP